VFNANISSISAILLFQVLNMPSKESLNSDGQQFTNINKTKESLNSDGQQFYQYQQNKRKFKQ
jgi:hypothetical protein